MQPRKKDNAQGVDVSHHNGTVDWGKVAADGISFVFLKASEGKTFVDKTFLNNAKAARAVGLLVGAYHFLNATSTGVAEVEARHFANTIKGVPLDLPPVLDYETNPGKLGKSQISEVARVFLRELERLTGRKPIIYTGNSFAGNFDSSLAAYPLWIARYNTQSPSDVSGWKRWEFWQYSGDGLGGVRADGTRKVNGINGHVDLNEFDGTEAELRNKYGPKKEEPNVGERDVNQVSDWAAKDWVEAKANGYFDGSRPGATITREETAIIINRLRNNFLKLIAGSSARISDLEERLKRIEKGGDLQ